jgi:hypothetical protein
VSRRDDRTREIVGVLEPGSPWELARAATAARALERAARSDFVRLSEGFADAVMEAIAREPLPSPVAALGRALRDGRPGGLLAGLLDSWRVVRTGDRPVAMRLQGLAFVLLVALLTVSLTATVAVGARELLWRTQPDTPSEVAPSPPPAPIRAVEAPSSAEPRPSPSVSRDEPTPPTAAPTADQKQSQTPRPATTPGPTETETPNETEEPGDSETPDATATPHPTDTPHPTETPGQTDDGGSGSGSG